MASEGDHFDPATFSMPVLPRRSDSGGGGDVHRARRIARGAAAAALDPSGDAAASSEAGIEVTMQRAMEMAMAASTRAAEGGGGGGGGNAVGESLMRAMLGESAGLLSADVSAEAAREIAAAVGASASGSGGGGASGSAASPLQAALGGLASAVAGLSVFGDDSDSSDDTPMPGLEVDPLQPVPTHIASSGGQGRAGAGEGGADVDGGSAGDFDEDDAEDDDGEDLGGDGDMPALVDGDFAMQAPLSLDDPNQMVVGGDPAVLFAAQLAQLAEMGFTDEDQLLPLLVQHGGQVERVMGSLF